MSATATQIVKDVRGYKRKSAIKHLPGFPVSHFTLDEMPTVRALIADGVLTEVTVEKPSLIPGREPMVYRYVRVA